LIFGSGKESDLMDQDTKLVPREKTDPPFAVDTAWGSLLIAFNQLKMIPKAYKSFVFDGNDEAPEVIVMTVKSALVYLNHAMEELAEKYSMNMAEHRP
jgi:hypothetical protein